MFLRQGLIGGGKVPMLWGGHANLLQRLHNYTGADVGMYGSAMKGISKTLDMKQALELPWAARYLDCDKDAEPECRERAYNGTCWVKRPDFEPTTKQRNEPTGRQKWHPGNRAHQLKGRVITFSVLRALEKGLLLWSEAENYILEDDLWHVTSHYESIRAKAASSVPKLESNDCYDMDLPDRVCTVPIQGRTEFTPRANPAETSIRSIVKRGTEHIPKPWKNIYAPPDIRNPSFEVPHGEVDYLRIIENGNEFLPIRSRMSQKPSTNARRSLQDDSLGKSETPQDPKIVPGKGWGLDTLTAADNCDGSYDSFCGRSNDNDCLLYAHNDHRGGLTFDGFSGWLVLSLSDMKHGIIILKIEDWHQSGENKKTDGWTCENNAENCDASADSSRARRERRRRLGENNGGQSSSSSRRLKPAVPEYCDDFSFEYAIDGNVTVWNLSEWKNREIQLQRVVQLWTLLDDENFVGGGVEAPGESASTKDVELAIRVTGCDRIKTFFLTHVYWA